MNPSSPNSPHDKLDIQPCPDCPYPMNILVNPLSQKDGKQRFAVTCRECGDSWTEVVTNGDEDEKQ